MYLEHNYWWYKDAFSESFCDEIIELAKSQVFGKGNISTESKEQYNSNLREANITWIDEQWIYDKIIPWIEDANHQSGWNFDIDYIEPLQFSHYKIGSFYEWHFDQRKPYSSEENLKNSGKYRKLSFSLLLNNPDEFEGGELEFDFYQNCNGRNNIHIVRELNSKGSLIVFPSFHRHRVTKITLGERYSLVGWILGYPYK